MSLALGLADGLVKLGIAVPEDAQARLIKYLGLIEKWNKVHNLTAIRDPEQMLAHHLLDSLAVLPHLGPVKRLADIGSGAGLPGIPLAIAGPDMAVTLVDSIHKRQAFQQQCKVELGLSNVTAIHSRVEDFKSEQGFDIVISRAFSGLGEFVNSSRHLCAPGGRLFAMKGLHPHEEIAKLPVGAHIREITQLQIPGLDVTRHLLTIEVD